MCNQLMSYSYKTLFIEAYERTNRLGLSSPCQSDYLSEGRIIDFFTSLKIHWRLSQLYKNIDIEVLSLQCFQVHDYIHMYIDKIIKHNAVFTIGFIKMPNSAFFEFDEKYLIKLLKEGSGKENFNMHAWLTFPSGEILDASILHSIAVKYNKKIRKHAYIGDYPESLTNMQYIPMVLGKEILYKLVSNT